MSYSGIQPLYHEISTMISNQQMGRTGLPNTSTLP